MKSIATVRFLALLAAACVCLNVSAGDFEKKFRIGVSVGALNGQDEVESDAGNVLNILFPDFSFDRSFADPRNDSAVFGNLEIQPGGYFTLHGQYAFTKIFVLEAAVGYQKTDLGDVEVQAQFDGVDVPDLERFDFRTFRIKAGEIERVPITLSAIARFRPRAKFNPYFGVGLGYTLVGFDASQEFNDLSVNMDRSLGGPTILTESTFGTDTLISPGAGDIRDLSGATVDVRDTFEYHIVGGAEYALKRKWSLVLDFRWIAASRSIRIGFDSGDDLGVAVPQLLDFSTSPAANTVYGAVRITEGGLIDGGRLWPDLDSMFLESEIMANPGVDPLMIRADFCTANPGACENHCAVDPGDCIFVARPDGQVDTGFYYVQGGEIDYESVSFQFGFRYTF